jgi:hypothetical protein
LISWLVAVEPEFLTVIPKSVINPPNRFTKVALESWTSIVTASLISKGTDASAVSISVRLQYPAIG